MVAYVAPAVLSRFQRYGKLQRVIGYCIRFIDNYISKKFKSGPLTTEELERADCSIIRMIQRECFPSELKQLKLGKDIDKTSKLIQLAPYLDENGMIRVGRRIRRAEISMDQKYPFIIPFKHFATTLILQREHIRLLHCGPEQLLSSVRHRYWPLSGRREARKITQKCIHCFKMKPQTLDVLMGDLPKSRLSGNLRPFTKTGVDYAGPILIKESRRRGRVHVSKAYLSVFVCLNVKAIHLELITDLTTEAFLAALTRFISRRGICSELYSDNGTNFVGAARELREMYEFVKVNEKEIHENLAAKRIQWKFIPPRAPHFGGLWEAAVKLMKKHFYTVTKGLTLTFEECYTLLTQIEALLNSRPLCPNPSDPHDLIALTPSHFLIGDSLVEPVQTSLIDTPANRLSL
ncbi:uncharacterized protein LOC117181261 [Belonocnema kinseyi]|uniref:uncharacterized protein LOC117181261 n=1 Tax=Belonocnema kinseyi TaxID=2817044 RepID=UPI00143D0C21|nr:uncharacterized protein LOC117181261 [Belonocnema kinseyi]